MLRKAPSVLLVLLLLLPMSVEGQVADTTRAATPPQRVEAATEGQVFLGAFQTILDYHQTTFSDSTLWEQALAGLVRGLNDPYATVFTPEQYGAFEEENTGDYAGIGVQITQLNDRVTVTAVFKKTPADDVGMMVGDQIIDVEGTDARAWTVDQARDSIRGPAGTVVEVTIAREGVATPLTFPIRRANVHVSAVHASTVHDSLGYILVDQVARGSAAEVDSAFGVLEDAQGIIFDLRRNPGGYFIESLSMADLLLAPGKTVANTVSRAPGRSNQSSEESFTARLPARIPEKPIIVLVDRYSASAAEIVAGALQDHDRAVVLGERTFGKGVMQTVMPLPGDRMIRLTTGNWATPLGRSLHIPRDAEGRPLQQEESDTFPVVLTEAGRSLRADGGVFPDLEIEDDTLTSAEQALIVESAQAAVPLTLRITEFAFEEVRRANDGSGPQELDLSTLDKLLDQLEEEGVPSETLRHPEAVGYLSWRARITFAQRADKDQDALEIQAERDRVLAAALRFLENASSQIELFAAVDAEAALARLAQETAGTAGQ